MSEYGTLFSQNLMSLLECFIHYYLILQGQQRTTTVSICKNAIKNKVFPILKSNILVHSMKFLILNG